MKARNDDLDALVASVQDAHKTRSVKKDQTWYGEVAVAVSDTVSYLARIAAIRPDSRWKLQVVDHGRGWVRFKASYHAVSANADDAEKLGRRLGDVGDVTSIAVRTDRVVKH